MRSVTNCPRLQTENAHANLLFVRTKPAKLLITDASATIAKTCGSYN